MKKILWSTVLGLSVVGMGGCAVSQKSVPSPPKPAPVVSVQHPPAGMVSEELRSPAGKEPLVVEEQLKFLDEDTGFAYPSLRYVNSRIFEYGRKLSRWKELDRQSAGQELSREETEKMVRCFRDLQGMLNKYGALRSKMIRAENLSQKMASSLSSSEVFELQRDDIGFLENDCGALLVENPSGGAGWRDRGSTFDLEELETRIARHTEKEEYEEVVQTWAHIPKKKRERVGLRTRIRYGNALMYLHQEEKAAEVYREVIEEMGSSGEQAVDLVSLRRVLADLYTAGGNYRAAGQQYTKISEDLAELTRLEEWARLQLSILDRAASGSPELSEYSSLLRNFLGFIPRKDGYNVVWQADRFLSDYPYSPVIPNVDFIKEVSTRLTDEWFSAQLLEVDTLAGAQKFQEAREYLDAIPEDVIGPEKQLQLRKKSEELLLASAVQKETEQREVFQDLQRRWNEAMLLARDRRYDEAISAFRNFSETDFAEKAAAKVAELMSEAAQAERKRAAQLYIRYTKTGDAQTQQQLLQETRDILKSILEKYPDVEIRSKVTDNLAHVERELNTLDSRLLLETESSPATGAEHGEIDAAFQLRPLPPPAPDNNSTVQ